MAGSLLGWLWRLPCTDAAVLMLRLGRRLCCECEPHGCAAAPRLLNECDGACCWLWLWPCVECPGCATSLSRLRTTVFAPPPSPNVQKKRRVLFRASTSESNENVCSRHGYSDLTVAQDAVR